jgi:NAD dependent epimerase/dehydratase family enzyme
MRVLVTGATGNLGRAVVLRLCDEGNQVSVLTRRPFLAAAALGARVTIHEWHPLSETVPAEAVDEVDAVLHLMGAPLLGSPAREVAAELVASRINTTRKLVEALQARPLRLVVASVAIAPGEAGPPVTEETPAAAKPSLLERDIRSWEAEALAAEASGASVAVVRLGLIATPGEPLAALLALARRGIAPGLKGALIPAIALEDAVAMLTGLLQHRALTGLIHGVAPEPVAGEHLMRALRRYAPTGRALAVPVSLLRRRLGLAAAILSCHRRIVPERLANAGADFAAPDPLAALERALDEIKRDRRGTHAVGLTAQGKAQPAAEAETT